ncbi:hypothetical protein MMC15_006373 [Xylographa vitiligo]|nr:hypothetical protein [Xylographa vitiligo]
MDSPTTPTPPLTSFRVLAFDIYGTLIDEPTALRTQLAPLLARRPPSAGPPPPFPTLLATFNALEHAVCAATPSLPLPAVMREVYARLAASLAVAPLAAEAAAFAALKARAPAYPDTVAAMRALGRRYRLVALSNIDRAGIAATLGGALAGVRFDAVLTAEEIGSYKPDRRNFEHLLGWVGREFGAGRGECLLVAQGVASDHVPAREVGLWSAWIARGRPAGEEGWEGVGEENEGKVGFRWRWGSLGEMAREVEEVFAEEEGRGRGGEEG